MFTPIPLSKAVQYKTGSWEGYSPKLKRDVCVAGDLEYDYWTFIETDPNIVDYCERPFILELNIPSTFSMWIKHRTGKEIFVKVKYKTINSQRTAERILNEIENEQNWCKTNGFHYLTISEDNIRHNHLELSNRRSLFSFVCNRRTPIEIDIYQIVLFLKDNKEVTIRHVQEALSHSMSNNRIMEAICWLIYLGKVNCDISGIPLGPRMEVQLECQKLE